MCQTCGCTPCEMCGDEILDGICAGCDMPSAECTCMAVEARDEPKESPDQP